MPPLLALFHGPADQWGIVDFLVMVIIIAACVGILYLALNEFGVQIPPVVIRIFWIVLVAILAIAAIRFVAGL